MVNVSVRLGGIQQKSKKKFNHSSFTPIFIIESSEGKTNCKVTNQTNIICSLNYSHLFEFQTQVYNTRLQVYHVIVS